MSCLHCNSHYDTNPQLKKLINNCGHSLCSSCVELIYWRDTGNCHECNAHLRKSDFREQIFENEKIDRSVYIRRNVLRVYNQFEDDFNSLEEYNNYLEEVESIIYNLENDIDILETNKKIEEYKRTNGPAILRNKYRNSTEQTELEEIIAVEDRLKEMRRVLYAEIDEKIKTKRCEIQQTFLEKLTKADPDKIEETMQEFKQSKAQLEAEIKSVPRDLITEEDILKEIRDGNTVKTDYTEAPKIKYRATADPNQFQTITEENETLFVYEPPKWDGKLRAVTMEDINEQNYLRHTYPERPSYLAGGYSHKVGCLKLLQSAFDI